MSTITNQPEKEWTQVMSPGRSLFRFNVRELWHYRDLIILFVKRDFTSVYKQTILGPLWHVVQPLVTTAVYCMVGGLVNISTDGLPRILFILSGVVIWNYFSTCLTKTSNTFIGNAHIFGKVYFPRLVIPISIVISNLMSFCIQFLIIIPFLIYYWPRIHPNFYILGTPFVILLIAMMGLGFGIIVSSLTIRYRDLMYLITFGVQLAVYATPVLYPLSIVPRKLQSIASLNPLSPVIEAFRFALLGQGTFTHRTFEYSCVFAVVILIAGIIMFNRVESDFMDTV